MRSAFLSHQQQCLKRCLNSSLRASSYSVALACTFLTPWRACSYSCTAQRQQQHVAASGAAVAAAVGSSREHLLQAADDVSNSINVESASSDDEEQENGDAVPELQLQLPEPNNVLVKTAEFVKSSIKVGDCPPPRLPEFAVIGRSNVGKSSLINMLTNRKSLAMVSKQPGKTRCINHFIINNSWYLVDLPGYGYARTGKETRKEFDSMTRSYFLQRPTLTMVFLLVDSSIPPQAIDLEYATWLGSKGVPFSIVFTKADKRKKGGGKKSANMAAFKRALVHQHGFAAVPPCVVTSAEKGDGKQQLLSFIASLRVLSEQHAATANK